MEWTKEKVHEIVLKQREFFMSNQTLDVKWRKEQLKKLKYAIINNEKRIEEALNLDLGRSEMGAMLLDIVPTIIEINECVHDLKKWAKPETHSSGLICFPSTKTKVYKMPYGVSLIVSPFNFPVLLTFGVLAAAISGGNTAVLKMSSKSKHVTACLQAIIKETFHEEYITVIDGGHDVADYCLEERFDKIFYTGSPNVGKHVMAEASKNLTPVALELGGENGNWAIVRKDADIKDAAKKLAFFKLANSGQICINVNQVAVAEDVVDEFLIELKKQFTLMAGENPLENEQNSRLIDAKAYKWCESNVEKYRDRVVYGGFGNPETLKYVPTVIYPVKTDEDIVNCELFCPILPVVPFKDEEIDSLLKLIASREHGLALYLFTKDIKWAKKVMQTQQYGGGCINEVCVHLMVKGVPFGGTGHSGMGAYHGVWGFREFTHPSTVLIGKNKFNLNLRNQPYTEKKKKILRMFIK